MNLDNLLNLAIDAANAGSKAILDAKNDIKIWQKKNNSPITNADINSNNAITEILSKSNIAICSEEQPLPYEMRKDLESFWLIDPLDGTKSFIDGSQNYCILIALIYRTRPILALIAKPQSNEIYYAHANSKMYKNGVEFVAFNGTKNGENIAVVSKHHGSEFDEIFIKDNHLKSLIVGSGLKFVALLEGRANIYHRFENLSSWDIAAGDFLINHNAIKAKTCDDSSLNSGCIGFMGDLDGNLINYNAPSFRCPYFIALSDKSLLSTLTFPKT